MQVDRLLQMRLITFLVALLATLSACSLFPNSKANRRASSGGGSSDVFVDGSIGVERSGDGTSATLRFETKATASCSIAWYPQNTNPAPTVSSLKWQQCVSPQPGRVFAEQITGLDPSMTYTYVVRLWAPGQKPEQGGIQRINEGVTPVDPNSVQFLNFDLTAKGARLESVGAGAGLDEARQKLLATSECHESTGADLDSPLGAALAKTDVIRMSSRGLVTGMTEQNSEIAGTLLMNQLSLVTTSSDWLLNIQSGGASGALRLNKPAFFKDVSATTTTKSSLVDVVLEDTDQSPIIIKKTSPVTIQWSLDGDLSSSVVRINLISYATARSIHCAAASTQASLTIPASLLTGFVAGKGALHVRVDTVQSYSAQRWLVRSTDWRTAGVSL